MIPAKAAILVHLSDRTSHVAAVQSGTPLIDINRRLNPYQSVLLRSNVQEAHWEMLKSVRTATVGHCQTRECPLTISRRDSMSRKTSVHGRGRSSYCESISLRTPPQDLQLQSLNEDRMSSINELFEPGDESSPYTRTYYGGWPCTRSTLEYSALVNSENHGLIFVCVEAFHATKGDAHWPNTFILQGGRQRDPAELAMATRMRYFTDLFLSSADSMPTG